MVGLFVSVTAYIAVFVFAGYQRNCEVKVIQLLGEFTLCCSCVLCVLYCLCHLELFFLSFHLEQFVLYVNLNNLFLFVIDL